MVYPIAKKTDVSLVISAKEMAKTKILDKQIACIQIARPELPWPSMALAQSHFVKCISNERCGT
jgi:hypothetical protein